MKQMPLIGIAGHWTAGLLVAVGLLLGCGAPPAAADEEVGAPRLLGLRLDAPDAYVMFRDNSAIESDFRVILRERDNPDTVVVRADVAPAPGEGRVVTRTVTGISAGVPLCATVHAQVREENPFNPRDHPPGGFPIVGSAASNTLCVDPNRRTPDVALEAIRGREELTGRVGATIAYLVAFRNDGVDADGTVTVDIATSGVLTLGDQAAVRAGWAAAGFTCATRAPQGGETAGLRCTGGSLKDGQRTNPAIMVRVSRAGFGAIHASISLGGDEAETDTSDNSATLTVRVY